MASDHHARTSPHAYPFPLTYTLYALSILLAATNTGLLGYFVADLRQDGMSVPYQFIILLSTTALTLPTHILLTHRHHTSHATRPSTSLFLNTLLTTLHITGLTLLSLKIGRLVLTNTCSTALWRTEDGVLVCRLYKTLFSFLIAGTIVALGCALLDAVTVWGARGAGQTKGRYEPMMRDERHRGFGLVRRATGWLGGVGAGVVGSEGKGRRSRPEMEGFREVGLGANDGEVAAGRRASWAGAYRRGFAMEAEGYGKGDYDEGATGGSGNGDGDVADAGARLVMGTPEMGYTAYQPPR